MIKFATFPIISGAQGCHLGTCPRTNILLHATTYHHTNNSYLSKWVNVENTNKMNRILVFELYSANNVL